MRQLWMSLALSLALLASFAPSGIRPHSAAAQDDGPRIDTLFQTQLEDAELPPTRVVVRLLYITMEPGSSNPRHTHPGPEFWRIDTGTVTVELQGPGVILRAGSEDPEGAPTDRAFELNEGDQLTILPSTPMFFSNKGNEEARILASVILPYGHQAPPGIDYLGKEPAANAYDGIRFPILGDGMLEIVPGGTKTITIDRIRLSKGDPIPAESNPFLLSVARGSLEFTVTGGEVQGPTWTDKPGPTDALIAPNTSITLKRFDAVFFPSGMKEAARADNLADATLYRVIISGDQSASTPVAEGDIGEISITGPIAEETPVPEATAAPEATAEATAEPTLGPSGAFSEGQTVYVNETDVRLRDAPTTESNILTGLTLGQELTITGAPVQANDITWWPVVSPVDPSMQGWVAEQFLSPNPIE